MKTNGETVSLLAAAAHELKAPLVLMRWLALSLGDSNLNLSEQEKQDYLDRLATVADRTLRLTTQLTIGSRLSQTNQLDFMHTLEPVNVNLLCEMALHELNPIANRQGQRLRFIKRRNQIALANRDIVHDILINLIDNALRYSPKNSYVDVSTQSKVGHIRMGVQNLGPSVALEDLRVLRSTIGHQPQPISGYSGSSGLGLYVASQLAESIGGNLSLGRPKEGALFFVDLIRSHQLKMIL